jgi:hypothetical protein
MGPDEQGRGVCRATALLVDEEAAGARPALSGNDTRHRGYLLADLGNGMGFDLRYKHYAGVAAVMRGGEQ